MENFIKIRGARQHNLKNISVDIPKNKLTVITGVSGSGKSSLAFDTLYAEGQRRYVESLSAYARQFLGIMDKPDVDSIEGLSPSISIDQKTASHNPRSTVGTITEIWDFLRLQYARVGHPHCPRCGREISRLSLDEMAEKIMAQIEKMLLADKIKPHIFLILSPVVCQKRGEFSDLFINLLSKGFRKMIIDGREMEISKDIGLLKNNKHDIEVMVDSVSVIYREWKDEIYKSNLLSRLRQALEISNGLSAGLTILRYGNEHLLFSEKFSCPVCNLSLPEMEPRLFSFNSPFGACEKCKGLGVIWTVSPDASEKLKARHVPEHTEIWEEELQRYLREEVCDVCHGQRLKPESLSVTVNNLNIIQMAEMPVNKMLNYYQSGILDSLNEYEKQVCQPIIKEISFRLNFLQNVGLSYLTISRTARTLSGGELQRIRLASQLGTGLTGVLYVLDEPSIGLHPKDIAALLSTLKNLRDLGNTLVVVEHDRETMEAADYLVELGPQAGREGGKVIFTGDLPNLLNSSTLTGKFLSGKEQVFISSEPLNTRNGTLILRGAKEHNLKNIDIEMPLGNLIAVTGVSGSGKSTLVVETLYPALKYYLEKFSNKKIGEFLRLEGWQNLDRVYLVDQSPIGRTPRSNPATYLGFFNDIRDLFAQTTDSREAGFNKSRFSFNLKGGRCEKCQGAGVIKVEMQFLADVYVTCDLCHGFRYNHETLEIKYKGKNIYEILQMTVAESLDFFRNHPAIYQKLSFLQKVGLDYLQMGQPAPTLSGGEAQRIKLSNELSRRDTGKTLYILDEPTTGLHFYDIQKLMNALYLLVSRGNTVIVIEHNLDVLKNCQYIIDLGPEGGDGGGYIMYQGELAGIIKAKGSYTGDYLNGN